MKKLVILFASLFVLVIAAENVNAQNTATGIAQSSATIIAPISINKDVDLSFGDIVRSSAAGTVAITTEGNRIFTGGVSAFGSNDGNPTPALFIVSGEDKATYSITIVNTSITVSNGDHTMTVNNITTSPTSSGKLTDGTQEIKVGATLNVSGNQAPGLYKNDDDLKITVAYN